MTLLSDINQAIQNQESFELIQEQDKTWKVKKHGFWDRFCLYFNSQKTKETTLQIAQVLKSFFLSKTTDEKSLIETSRNFTRSLNDSYLEESDVKELRIRLLAKRLHLPYEVLNKNQEFAKFADTTKIYNYLDYYKHSLKIVDEDIQILKKNTYVSFKTLDYKVPVKARNFQHWVYGKKGLKNTNMFLSTIKTPKIRKLRSDLPKNGKCFLEIKACNVQNPRCRGDHVWMILNDGQGNEYSAGFYRPYNVESPIINQTTKSTNIDEKVKEVEEKLKHAGEYTGIYGTESALVMSPDISDHWGVKTQSLQIPLDVNSIEDIKAKIESMLIVSPAHYNIHDSNCVALMNEVLKESLEIHLAAKVHLIKLFYPNAYAAYKKMPVFIQRVIKAIFTFFFNLLIWGFCGARNISKDYLSKNESGKPFMNFKDLTDPDKAYISHPFEFTKQGGLFERIEKWRQVKGIDILTTSLRGKDTLPPECYL